MTACYILYTVAFDKFYVGATQEGVSQWLEKHNTKAYDNASTAYTNDWEIFLIIDCGSYAQATNIERHIKRMKSKTYIKNLTRYPEMISKLLQQYQAI